MTTLTKRTLNDIISTAIDSGKKQQKNGGQMIYYCDTCAKKRDLPTSNSASWRRCRHCKQFKYCNEVGDTRVFIHVLKSLVKQEKERDGIK